MDPDPQISPPSSGSAPRHQVLLRGIIVAFAGGFSVYWLLPVSPLPPVLFLPLSLTLIGCVAGMLAPRPEALFLLPMGAWVGLLGADLLRGIVNGFLSRVTWWGGWVEFAAILLALAALPALAGAVVGVLMGLLLTRQ